MTFFESISIITMCLILDHGKRYFLSSFRIFFYCEAARKRKFTSQWFRDYNFTFDTFMLFIYIFLHANNIAL